MMLKSSWTRAGAWSPNLLPCWSTALKGFCRTNRSQHSLVLLSGLESNQYRLSVAVRVQRHVHVSSVLCMMYYQAQSAGEQPSLVKSINTVNSERMILSFGKKKCIKIFWQQNYLLVAPFLDD